MGKGEAKLWQEVALGALAAFDKLTAVPCLFWGFACMLRLLGKGPGSAG